MPNATKKNLMDLCLATFKSFVVQWSAKIAGRRSQLKLLPRRFLCCVLFSKVHLLFNFKGREYYNHHMKTESIT